MKPQRAAFNLPSQPSFAKSLLSKLLPNHSQEAWSITSLIQYKDVNPVKGKGQGMLNNNVWCACTYQVDHIQDGGDIWKNELKFKLHLAMKCRHLELQSTWKQNSLEASWNSELGSWCGRLCMLILCVFTVWSVECRQCINMSAAWGIHKTGRLVDMQRSALGSSVGCRWMYVYTWSEEDCMLKTCSVCCGQSRNFKIKAHQVCLCYYPNFLYLF